jgi:hypothetical protein
MKRRDALILLALGAALLLWRSRAQAATATAGLSPDQLSGYAGIVGAFQPPTATVVEANPASLVDALIAAGKEWGMTSYKFTTAEGTFSGRTPPVERDPVAFTNPWTDERPSYTQKREER